MKPIPKRNRIQCECGRDSTANTLKQHILSKKCTATQGHKDKVLQICKTAREQGSVAWRKSLGAEAIRERWIEEVLEGRTNLQDWQFQCPRENAVVRPSTLAKYAIDRRGDGNPFSKVHRIRDLNPVIEYARQLWETVKVPGSKISILKMSQLITEKFGRGWRFNNNKSLSNADHISRILGIDRKIIDKIALKKQGELISEGQKNSPKYRAMASKCASEMTSTWRITRPQRELYEMIKAMDGDAKLEYREQLPDGRQVSFDVYSPRFNAFIEMHGRVWHDPQRTVPKLAHLVASNLVKDQAKKELAEKLCKQYRVFWDDERSYWETDIEQFFGIRSVITIEEAEDRVNQEIGAPTRRRYNHAERGELLTRERPDRP